MEIRSADDATIHYEVRGAGPTVILAHGSLMQGAAWIEAGYVDALSGFTCVVMDCRGYGASTRPHSSDAYTVERYVDDIAAVADACDAQRFAIVGYSWGTAGAWHAAAAFPDRVAALVAIGGWHPNLYSFDLEVMEKLRIQPMRDIGVEGFAEYMKSQEGPLPAWWERQVRVSDPHSYIAQRYAAVTWTRLAPARVRVPTLLISGAEEDSERDSLLVAGALEQGEAALVEGAGHCQTFLSRQAISATKDFLDRTVLG